jgi:hypothetical protein
MSTLQDRDYAHGKRRPGHVPGRQAAEQCDEIDLLVHQLENKLSSYLLDTPQAQRLLDDLDQVGEVAKGLIRRYNRNGPLVTQSRKADMEAVIRIATELPDNFKGTDIPGMKKIVAELTKKGVA